MICNRDANAERLVVQCPQCEGSGCDQCHRGGIDIGRCPREYVGSKIARAVNIASQCGNGTWPIEGGLLRQSAWFMDLKNRLDSDEARIDRERK